MGDMIGGPIAWVLKLTLQVVFAAVTFLFGLAVSHDAEGNYYPKQLEQIPKEPDRQIEPWESREILAMAMVGLGLFGCFLVTQTGFLRDVGLFFFLGVFLVGFYRNERYKPEYAESSPVSFDTAQIYSLTFPPDVKFDPAAAAGLMHQLVSSYYTLGFRIEGTSEGIVYQVIDPRGTFEPEAIELSLRSIYPEVEITRQVGNSNSVSTPFYRGLGRLRLTEVFPAPIAQIGDLKDFDPLATFTQAIDNLEPGERVSFNLFVTTPAWGAGKAAEAMLTTSDISKGEFLHWFYAIGATLRRMSGEHKQDKYAPHLTKVMVSKITSGVYHTVGFIQFDTPDPGRGDLLTGSVPNTLNFSKPDFNSVVMDLLEPDVFPVTNQEEDEGTDALAAFNKYLTEDTEDSEPSWWPYLMVLAADELASLWHVPYERFTAPGMPFISGVHVPVPKVVAQNTTGILLGDNKAGGKETPVYLHPTDRQTHMLTIGRTGTGKSTFYHNLIHQDIAAGSGVCVIDPHGDLVTDILLHSIPEKRKGDVYLWDLSNPDYPPPLNPLKVPSGFDRATASTTIMEVFAMVYGESFGTREMADTLEMSLSLVMEDETPTLRDIGRLARDADYRNRLIALTESEDVVDFWEDLEAAGRGEIRNLFRPVLRRLRQFYGHKLIYPMLCHPDGMDFYSLMREKKIVLINLNPPDEMRLEETDQQFLGALMVAQLYIAAMASAAKEPFFAYIDEAQKFVSTKLDVLFREARKRKLSMNLATQNVAELAKGDVFKTVMGNVGALAAFQSSDQDAKVIAPYMRPSFTSDQLMKQDTYRMAVFMRHQNNQQPAFSVDTRPAPSIETKGDREKRAEDIRKLSQKNNRFKSQEEVLSWLRERYPRRRAKGTEGDEPYADPIE